MIRSISYRDNLYVRGKRNQRDTQEIILSSTCTQTLCVQKQNKKQSIKKKALTFHPRVLYDIAHNIINTTNRAKVRSTSRGETSDGEIFKCIIGGRARRRH